MITCPIYLFVYGTLMLDYPQNPLRELLENTTVTLGRGRLAAKMYFVDEAYPAIIENLEGESFCVKGEVLEVKQASIFTQLDAYEECEPLNNGVYIRKKKEVVLETSQEVRLCWIYFFNRPTEGLPQILSGDFLESQGR
jgi:pyruvate carboxylase